MPIFRGDVYSVRAVAEEIVALRHGPCVTQGLRYRLEAATGVDCSGWVRPEGGFDHARAAATARELLTSGALDQFEPGGLYFFGHPVRT